MSETDLNKKVDDLEAAAEKYASKDTVISIGGYSFTPAKLMVAFTLVSSLLGGLYAAFEVYKDYMSMKTRIAEYVAPDMAEFDKKLAVVEENSTKAVDYTRDIKNDLKQDIRRLEGVVESVERSVKTAQREVDIEIKNVKTEVNAEVKTVRKEIDVSKRETESALKQSQKDLDSRIQKALDNPLNKL